MTPGLYRDEKGRKVRVFAFSEQGGAFIQRPGGRPVACLPIEKLAGWGRIGELPDRDPRGAKRKDFSPSAAKSESNRKYREKQLRKMDPLAILLLAAEVLGVEPESVTVVQLREFSDKYRNL